MSSKLLEVSPTTIDFKVSETPPLLSKISSFYFCSTFYPGCNVSSYLFSSHGLWLNQGYHETSWLRNRVHTYVRILLRSYYSLVKEGEARKFVVPLLLFFILVSCLLCAPLIFWIPRGLSLISILKHTRWITLLYVFVLHVDHVDVSELE